MGADFFNFCVTCIYLSSCSVGILTNKYRRPQVTFGANSRRSIIAQSLQTGKCRTAIPLHGCLEAQALPTCAKVCVTVPAFKEGFCVFFEDDIEMDQLFEPGTEPPRSLQLYPTHIMSRFLQVGARS